MSAVRELASPRNLVERDGPRVVAASLPRSRSTAVAAAETSPRGTGAVTAVPLSPTVGWGALAAMLGSASVVVGAVVGIGVVVNRL